ncbi:PIN-like domain-containing protein [Metabacillus sp. GX 13764]|uniref:PIN-like domain-containing protein n=1 Tax=Metabacillus kandeliae TaxID=2900151 RepID=UPI001E52F0BD|nr:PIN-like domain-containing protein [Metabacillus kandeliae]MCD7034350.1 PIN-like domain-containing protein [Metabacillus kandeliae]
MLHQFKGFIGYSKEEYKELWASALFVVDTNVLLNFYKYTSKESTKSLMDILKFLKNAGRLWIPHQVALEYFFNYETNMFKQHEGYNLLGSELKKLKDSAEKTLRSVQSEHPYIVTDKFQFFIENMEQSNAQLQEKLDKELAELSDSNSIQDELLILLNGVVGEPYSQERIDVIEKDGKNRYKLSVPPGFKDIVDKKKESFRTYGDFRYQQLYGDLIVWHQMLDKAKLEDKLTPIIFITEEKKEDWWEKDGSKVKRPHPQLIQEFINKTSQKFYMYRTENFVRYAKDYLEADFITDEQVENVTKDVEHIRRSEEKESSDLEKEYAEAIHRDIDKVKLKKLDIGKLMEFMSEEEKETFRKRLDIAFSIDTHPGLANTKYNHAIDWAVKVSINQLENRLRNLLRELAIKDNEKVQSYLSQLDSIPKNNADKGLILLEYIKEIENTLKQIAFQEAMDDLPF